MTTLTHTNQGEIDIVEGVNDHVPNRATIHTSSGCIMPMDRIQLGTALTCDSSTSAKVGCGVDFHTENSYGPPFNSNGGGWYALERTNRQIRVWFWPRDGTIPSDVSSGASTIDPDNWGTPDALFPDMTCDIASHFDQHNIAI
ncbi:hypothetical protein AX17_002043 [Amanita inopinata Kibby_2008]|nr:hypothetical protein AX17_002043 [Amanita inopinata Kibby_2008]